MLPVHDRYIVIIYVAMSHSEHIIMSRYYYLMQFPFHGIRIASLELEEKLNEWEKKFVSLPLEMRQQYCLISGKRLPDTPMFELCMNRLENIGFSFITFAKGAYSIPIKVVINFIYTFKGRFGQVTRSNGVLEGSFIAGGHVHLVDKSIIKLPAILQLYYGSVDQISMITTLRADRLRVVTCIDSDAVSDDMTYLEFYDPTTLIVVRLKVFNTKVTFDTIDKKVDYLLSSRRYLDAYRNVVKNGFNICDIVDVGVINPFSLK